MMKCSVLPLLLACFAILAGCKALPQATSSFVSPLKIEELGSSASTQILASSDEYQLCLETARTVAGEGHFSEAIKLYEKAESLSPNGKSFNQELAPLYAQAGRFDEASERYSTLVEENASPEIANNFAWTLLEAGRLAAAERVIQNGLLRTPNDARLASTLAIIRFKQGDKNSSLEILSKVHGPSTAHHNLAVLELEANCPDASLSHLETACNLPGCSAETHELRQTLLAQLSATKSTVR